MITLAEMKGYLGLEQSSDNDILRATIRRTTAMIEGVTGRTFSQAWRSERLTTDDRNVARLKWWPVSAVEFVGRGPVAGLDVTGTDATDTLATVSVDDDRVELVRVTSAGVQTVTEVGEPVETMAQLATAITAVSGFSAVALVTAPWRTLERRAAVDVRGCTQGIDAYAEAVEWSMVDRDAGVLSVQAPTWPYPESPISTWQQRSTIVAIYRSGYPDTPEDVKQVALEVAAIIYRTRRYDTGQTTGDYRTIPSAEEITTIIRESLAHRMEVR